MRLRWWSVLIALGVVLAPLPSQAITILRRLTNMHGSECQTADAETQHAQYSDTGILIKTDSTPMTSLACPTPWSQDQGLLATQKLTVTLNWISAPTGGSFTPSCMFYLLTVNGGELFYGSPDIINPGTSNPTYVFTAAATATVPLPAYGAIIGSAVYCQNVPAGVGVTGYNIEACFATSLLGGC